MYCGNCGKRLENGVCPDCYNDSKNLYEENESTFLWGVLGFFIPIVGFVLFLVWQNTYKKRAKSSGIGALVRLITNIVAIIVTFIILFILASNNVVTNTSGIYY